jgi:RNA polymerase sigma-70 factor (ECF subfamily)
MLRAKDGEVAAFEVLVDKFRRPLVSFLFRIAHDQSVAEELAQETFLRMYRSRKTYAAGAKLTTWIYRIATSLAANHIRDARQESAKVAVSIDERDEQAGLTPDVAGSSPSSEQAILRRERLAAIRRHIDALPERQRLAVLMHKYQGLDYQEIAEVLELSESATRSLLFQGYATLQQKLREYV